MQTTTYIDVATGLQMSEEEVESIFGTDLTGLFEPELTEDNEIFNNLQEN